MLESPEVGADTAVTADDRAALLVENSELRARVEAGKHRIHLLEEALRVLKASTYGPSRERLSVAAGQVELFNEIEATLDITDAVGIEPDEVDAMHKVGKVRNPIGLVSVLARRAGLGQFSPNYSIRVDSSRPVAARRGEDRRTGGSASLSVEPTAVSELGRRVLSDLRKRLSPEVPMGDEPAAFRKAAE